MSRENFTSAEAEIRDHTLAAFCKSLALAVEENRALVACLTPSEVEAVKQDLNQLLIPDLLAVGLALADGNGTKPPPMGVKELLLNILEFAIRRMRIDPTLKAILITAIQVIRNIQARKGKGKGG